MLGTALTQKTISSTREVKCKRSVKHTPKVPQDVPKATNVWMYTSSGTKMIQQTKTDAMFVELEQSKLTLTPQGIAKDLEDKKNISLS